ncbi:MAG: hypothetical protein GY833_16530 [Aestuariibacter sp.]|nr:hypothetical protein [Aestuariibacter sp.]
MTHLQELAKLLDKAMLIGCKDGVLDAVKDEIRVELEAVKAIKLSGTGEQT